MAIEEIKKNKLESLESLKRAGVSPYPIKSWRTHTIKEALDNFEELSDRSDRVVLVGRIMAKREHGGSIFINIYDGSGDIQLYLKKDEVGELHFNIFKEHFDVGDFFEGYGVLFVTKKGENSLKVEKFRMLSKSLLPMPEKWHGLKDVEERFRRRYLDLIFNKDVKEKFMTRFKIVHTLREYFSKAGFLEVETPILQSLAGGATANPFATHMDTLDVDLFLRIAPELYLKRLLVGGLERVFELGRSFRNEGMSREHNPEFTMLEAYAAYKDHEWLMGFVENLFKHLAEDIVGKDTVHYGEHEINLTQFERKTFDELFQEYLKIDLSLADDEDLEEIAKAKGVKMDKGLSRANLIDELWKKLIRPHIIQPTFLLNHPIELSPLSKKLEDNEERVARFQLIIAGSEFINAFSELNDPIDQKERFEAQEKMRKKEKVPESHRFDKDYIEALEYGMPPAAGLGLGVDRLVMLLTNSHSIREVILFPFMKPKE